MDVYRILDSLPTNMQTNLAWVHEHQQYALCIAALYLWGIFAGTRYMARRPAFRLGNFLVFWNLVMAFSCLVFSVAIARILWWILKTDGFHGSLCVPNFLRSDQGNAVMDFISVAFLVFRIVALGDTAMVILKKGDLSFLHCYHHATFIVFSWLSSSERASTRLWLGLVNSSINFCMYFYLALRAMRVKLKYVGPMITFVQLLQMALGLYLNNLAYDFLRRGQVCHVSLANITFAVAMYFTFLLLYAYSFARKQAIIGKGQKGF